ncbi:interferon-induced very large GTPase 1-like [Mantella aurantiaca]
MAEYFGVKESFAKDRGSVQAQNYESFSNVLTDKERRRTEDCHTLLDKEHLRKEEKNEKSNPSQRHKPRSQSDPGTNKGGEGYRHSHKQSYPSRRPQERVYKSPTGFQISQSNRLIQPSEDDILSSQQASEFNRDPGTSRRDRRPVYVSSDDSSLKSKRKEQKTEPEKIRELDLSKRTSKRRGEQTMDSSFNSKRKQKTEANKDLLYDVRMIGSESCTQITPAAQAEFQFLTKLMALDATARIYNLDQGDDFENDVNESFLALNPLDILCGILKTSCKNHISQQQIITKMAMCHFAVPLLLPAGDGLRWNFMLWTMRDIVKRWRPQSLVDAKGFREDNLVNISMPICSFTRLGECSVSKSKILNCVLSPTQQSYNFFVHRDMKSGNITKKTSDGLVEMSWYFPSGQEVIDVFSEPVAIANLRGDLESHTQQFQFLLSISTAMFIFLESINEKQYKLLSGLSEKRDTQYFFIINASNVKPAEETMKFLSKLSKDLKLKKMNVIIKNKNVNVSQVVLKLQSTMKAFLINNKKVLSLRGIADKENMNKFQAHENNILVDEDSCIFRSVKTKARNITEAIEDIAQYKKETMKLQGDLWNQVTKAEKEMCRMRELGDKDPETYKSQLQTEILNLRRKQSTHKMPKTLEMFKDETTKLLPTEMQLFIKWLSIHLDKAGRSNLSTLQAEYGEKFKDLTNNVSELKNIDQRIANSSLGIEHFLRELGQFYEAAKFMKEGGQETNTIYSELPKIASNMLLEGFPVELIDGDASNIPLLWITDVLKELDIKTGGQSIIRVITVLGVQSTGKSTLLNTMFGLEFPVASGRCTRGAFMTLLNVDKNFQKILGCQYILVIDTEGLKSMELASLEGSYEHDNELATVVVGLSDITIVNMAMENTEEMKDILQIVVHAFLRMKEVGKKPSCHFVHQNVSDVSAHVKNQRARQKFLEQLNELTKIAAKMEKRSGITCFSDIIYCDLEKHSWYIPSLWCGIPPMASVNMGYSESIKQFKKYIIESLQSMPGKAQTINEFTEWLKSLWNAVKHEKFIFSFRNRLVTEAYNQLCIEYSDWEWRFQKNAHHWMIKMETLIYNLSSDKLVQETWNTIVNEIYNLMDKEEKLMSQSLENFFERGNDNAHLLDMFRGDFFRSVNYLRKELENTLVAKCDKTMRIQREKCEIQAMQEQYINRIEGKVTEIMEANKRNRKVMSLEQLKREFEMMWQNTLSTLQLSKLERQNIEQIIIHQLKQDMKHDEHSLHILYNLTSLDAYKHEFTINEKHHFSKSHKDQILIQKVTSSLLHECNHYVSKCANTSENFNEMLSQELLKIINKSLNNQDVRHFSITKRFELDLKMHILGRAASTFQKMHNDFVQKNDPRSCLEMLKPEYFSIFRNMFEKRNECQRRAKQFCELCLKPAIIDHINRHLGKEIVEEILQKGWEFKSHTLFQNLLLTELLQNKSCKEYAKYINDYEGFVKSWIFQYILKHYNEYRDIQTLQLGILTSLAKNIFQALDSSLYMVQASDVSAFLLKFCNILKEDLVISPNNLKVVTFQSNVDIEKFINDIEAYLPDLLKDLQMEMTSASVSSVLLQLNLKPQDELAKKVIGCGKQCPFCKAPCEAGGADHKEHFASIHRPRGLAKHKDEQTGSLDHSICSTNVISNKNFRNTETEWKPHPYKDYRTIYPDWAIYPDTTANGSDYWKFVFKEFNDTFADLYKANPADHPKEWNRITEDQALKNLKTA